MADSFKPDSFKADLPGDSFKPDSFTADRGKTAGQGNTGLRLKTPKGQRDPSLLDWFPHAAAATEPHAGPDALMGGLSDVGRFMAMAASPAAVGPALAAPVKAAVGMAAAYPIQQLVQGAGEMLGFPGTGALGGDVAGVAAGRGMSRVNPAGAKAALTTGVGTAVRKIPGISLPLDMLDAYRSAAAPPPEIPEFGSRQAPNPAKMPSPAPPRPMGFDPRAAPNPAVMPPRAPIQVQPEPLFGPGKAPNPARMPPRAPTAEPGVPTPKTQPTPEIKPVQPTEDDWQDTNRALHAMAQEKELPGSPAGSRKGAHDYVKSLAKSLYNVNSTADLDVSQMKNIQEMIRTGKIPKK